MPLSALHHRPETSASTPPAAPSGSGRAQWVQNGPPLSEPQYLDDTASQPVVVILTVWL